MIDDMEEDNSKYKVEFLGEKHCKEYITYKVIILGMFNVGKTTIIGKLMKLPDQMYEPTLSLDIKNIQIKVNDKIIQIQFWDTCGNDEFAGSTPNLFKNASLAILVFAINDHKSFDNLRSWYNLVKEHSFDNTLFLIGNKNDLKKEREVTMEEVENFKKSYDNIKMFFETSAKSGENIDKLLDNIAISIYAKNVKEENEFENAMNDNKFKRSIKLFEKNHKKN